MGDANKEIAFGGVTAGAITAGVVGAASHLADPTGPTTRNALVGGTLAMLGATAYLWHAQKTPGSWVNPVLTEHVPPSGNEAAKDVTVVANPTPPTPLGTTVAFIEILGTIAGAIAAVSVVNEWQQKQQRA